MNYDELVEGLIFSLGIFFLTHNNLFALFIQLFFGLTYSGICKEITFYFYFFLSSLFWMLLIKSFFSPKYYFNSGNFFKDKIINLFIRKDLKKMYFYLKDKSVFYGVFLSIVGGLIGLFSLGNLYNKLYKRFIIQFIVGIIITGVNLILIYNFPLTLNISDICFYFIKYPFISMPLIIYYILTINDTYECAVTLKNNKKLHSFTNKDKHHSFMLIIFIICGSFLVTNIQPLSNLKTFLSGLFYLSILVLVILINTKYN